MCECVCLCVSECIHVCVCVCVCLGVSVRLYVVVCISVLDRLLKRKPTSLVFLFFPFFILCCQTKKISAKLLKLKLMTNVSFRNKMVLEQQRTFSMWTKERRNMCVAAGFFEAAGVQLIFSQRVLWSTHSITTCPFLSAVTIYASSCHMTPSLVLCLSVSL